MNAEIQPTAQENTNVERLKLVIAVRHGECDENGLDERGRIQVQDLACKINGMIPDGLKIGIFSSTYDRARQSADIIAKHLGTTFTALEELCEDDHKSGEFMRQAILPKINGSEVLIAVSHNSAPSGIINAFSKRHFGRMIEPRVSRKGSGFLIDLGNGRLIEDLMAHGL